MRCSDLSADVCSSVLPPFRTTVTYDANGRVATSTNHGVTYSYSYADSGTTRTTTGTDPNGQTQVYVGDTSTNLLASYRDALYRTTSYLYDINGRVTEIADPEGNKIQLTYDARGNVTENRAISKTPGTPPDIVTTAGRSEEHTSELQSLMRISYAVFCLNKQNTH